MNLFTVIKTLGTLVPTLVQIIQALDVALPESGQGNVKLAALKSILQGAYSVSTDAGIAFEKLWPAVETVVGGLVAMFKK